MKKSQDPKKPETLERSEPAKKTNLLRDWLHVVGREILYGILPLTLGILISVWLVDVFHLVSLGFPTSLIVFIAIVSLITVSFTFLIVIAVDWLEQLEPDRPRLPEKRIRKITRLFIGIIVVPVVVSVIANLVPVSGGDTLLTLFIKSIQSRNEYPFITKISNGILSSSSMNTKRTGLNTLKTIHCSMCQSELLRILEQDKDSLDDYGYYGDLAAALASYMPKSRGPLLAIFAKYDAQRHSVPTGDTGTNLHAKYFEQSMNALKEQLKNQSLDRKKKEEALANLAAIDAKLLSDLSNLEATAPSSENGDPVLRLVLDSFLYTDDLSDDSEIYFLAKRIASDSSYNDETRKTAILLVAKLGSQDDFDNILPFLQDKRETIKGAAMQAIGNLHSKITKQKKSDGNQSGSSQSAVSQPQY